MQKNELCAHFTRVFEEHNDDLRHVVEFSRGTEKFHRSLPLLVLDLLNTERKEMFYLTMHSTHFIYGYMASDIRWRTTQIAREETCLRHIGYSFRLGLFYMHHPTDRIAHTTAFVTPVVEHWLERECWTQKHRHVIHYDISRSSQCSTIGVTKAVVCAIQSVGWYI